MGDAFSRWDGFSYYGTFADFLPSAALVAIFWFLVAVFTALLLSITGVALKSFYKLPGWNITIQHHLLFTIFFLLSGVACWFVKRRILHLGITIQITLIELACALTLAVFATWLLRSKAEQWIAVIQDRISPLVWLYGIWVILSVPLVAYHTWGNHSDTIQAKNLTQLFNLKNDPDELNNLIDKEPAIGQHLLSLVMDKVNKANQAFNKRQQPIQ